MKKRGYARRRPSGRGELLPSRSNAAALAAMLALPVLASAQPVVLTIPDEANAVIFSSAPPPSPHPGWRTSVLGDINDDGIADIAVAPLPFYSVTGLAIAHVFFGPLSGLHGDAESSFLGFDITASDGRTLVTDISGAGDVNGDGLDDIVVATYTNGITCCFCCSTSVIVPPHTGAFVVFGKSDHDAVDLSSIAPTKDVSAGFAITGFQQDAFPILSVDGAGDFNGDGFDDVIVGHLHPLTVRGAAFVVFGKDDTLPVDVSSLDGSDGVLIDLPTVAFYDIVSVAGGGDVNGDDLADVVVRSESTCCCCSSSPSVSTYVVFGKDDPAPDTIAMPPADGDGFEIFTNPVPAAPFSTYYFGTSVDIVGDMDGDGLDDILVQSPEYFFICGTIPSSPVHIIFGKDDNSPVDLVPRPIKKGKKAAKRAAEKVAVPEFVSVLGSYGASACKAGDVDGDGLDDIIVRSYLTCCCCCTCFTYAAVSHVIPGKDIRADLDPADALFAAQSFSPVFIMEGGDGIGLFSQFVGSGKLIGGSEGFVSVVDFRGLVTPPPSTACPPGGGFVDSPDGRIADDAGGANRDDFGRSVSSCGDTAVIGAPLADPSGLLSAGTAYVADYDGASTWTLGQVLVSPTPAASDSFGAAVAIGGDLIVVGEPFDDTNGLNAGAAHVYRRSTRKGAGSSWFLEATIYGSDAGTSDRFGSSVAVFGDRIVVGAPYDVPRPRVGAVYVFEYDGSSTKGVPTWTETAKLTPSDGYSGDAFGASVSIDGDIVAVGSPGDDDNGSSSGSLYVFTLSGATWIEAKGTAPDGQSGDALGSSVDMVGTAIVAGAPGEDDGATNSGAAYLFESLSSTTLFSSDRAKAASPWLGAAMGSAVAITPEALLGKGPGIGGSYRVAAGAPLDDQGGGDAGAVHVFAMGGIVKAGGAFELEKHVATVPDSVDYNGTSVDITGFTTLSGAPWGNRLHSGAQEPGTAYFFTPVAPSH